MILSPADYPTIRTILRVGEIELPDATLALVMPLADREIKRMAPAWESYSGTDLEALQDAVRYLTAVRAAAFGATEEVAGFGFKIGERTIDTADLYGLAYAALAELGLTFSRNFGFAVQMQRSDGYTALA